MGTLVIKGSHFLYNPFIKYRDFHKYFILVKYRIKDSFIIFLSEAEI